MCFVESCGAHGLLFAFYDVGFEYISRLLCESLLKKGVSSNNRSITSILWDDTIFSLNRFEPVGHVIVTSPIHMARSPIEEIAFRNCCRSLVLRIVKLGIGLTAESVIERRIFRFLEGVMEFSILRSTHFYLL